MTAGLPKQPTNPTNTTLNTNSILNVLINLQNIGRSKATIQCTDKILNYLNKHADLTKPETIKHFIAMHQCTKSYKKNMCLAYNRFCQYYKIQWEMPKYKPEKHNITIPTRQKLEMLIANAGRIMATKLKLSLETGLRPIELTNLKVKDIDLERNRVHPTTAKNGNPRTLKISKALKNMLTDYISRKQLHQNDKMFNTTPRGYSKMYRITRNKLANKLHEPTLENIRLYDFRHYFATNLYRKTRDILHVMQQLGHKNIENTLIYIHLADLNEDDENEWTCKATANTKEATKLLENGFTYILTTPDKLMLFRKRK